MVSVSTSEMEAPLKKLPRHAAFMAYKWILGLSTKGEVTAYISQRYEKDVFNTWKGLRTGLRWHIHYMRLWKGVSTFYTQDCRWCVHYCAKRCGYRSASRCGYNYSIRKAAKLFDIDHIELKGIQKSLSPTDIRKFKAFLKNSVTRVVTLNEEKEYHTRVIKEVLKTFTKTHNISAKMYKSRYLDYYYGICKEDIEGELHSQLVILVKRYDYLAKNDLLKTCSRALSNHLRNIMASYETQKRKNLFKCDSINDEGYDFIPNIPTDSPNPEDVLLVLDIQSNTRKLISTLDGELKVAMEILLGQEHDTFIAFLKNKQLVRGRAKWNTFYRQIEPVQLMTLISEFTGKEDLQPKLKETWVNFYEKPRESIDFVNKHKQTGGTNVMGTTELLQKVIAAKRGIVATESFLPPKPVEPEPEPETDNLLGEGEEEMEERQLMTIQVPKAKCAICGYWVPWLKKEPADCSPSYPGCPIHTYDWEKAFPIEQAAEQLIDFLGKGDDSSIKEFVEAAPNIADILNAALGILMDLMTEDDDDEDNGVESSATYVDTTAFENDEVEEDEVMVVGKIDPQ